MNPIERTFARIVQPAPPAPGFIGAGHTAVEVVYSDDLVASDPFVLLMDDRLEIAERRQMGGAHPHAGLETVTFVLDGEVHDRDEGALTAGDVLWMNAGRGVIHSEHIEAVGRVRILQLWIRLPSGDRDSAPAFERISAPLVREETGAEIRLYSGSTGDLRSATHNHVPITMVDVRLRAGAAIAQELPASYNGFVYALDGMIRVGERTLTAGQVGWLDRPDASGDSVLRVRAPEGPARFVLYAGEPQREPLIHHGPFVAGTREDVAQLFRAFHSGRFEALSGVAARQRAVA
jgi:quercetin 2,3-dioxygenase